MMLLLVVRGRGHMQLLLLLTMAISFFRFLLVSSCHTKSLSTAHIILLASTFIDFHTPLREWNNVEFLLVFVSGFYILLK